MGVKYGSKLLLLHKMKNLLIYINPEKKFLGEYETLTKIQIDNSIDLGWKIDDILLATNFDYEYRGVRSVIVDDYGYWDQNRSSKIQAINQLFTDGYIKEDLYWFHDHDAFQLSPIDIKFKKDFGFTDHGAYSKTWNAGSFFFKNSAKDIFLWIYDMMIQRRNSEQDAFTFMWVNDIGNIKDRCELVNQTYNIGIYKIEENVKRSEKPIKVLHFHPHKSKHLRLFRSLIPDRLMKIFNEYGIKL